MKHVKNSNFAHTILNSVIRNDNGKLQVYQCRPKLRTEQSESQHKIAFNNKTAGDITNRLHWNNHLRNIVRGR